MRYLLIIITFIISFFAFTMAMGSAQKANNATKQQLELLQQIGG